jgi:ribose transport system substrate-binding protein
MLSTEGPGNRRLRGAATAVLAVLALSAGLAACGGDDDEGASSGSGGAASAGSGDAPSAGLKASQAFAKEAATFPTDLGLPKSEKPIPSGKTVTYVHCGVEVCTTIANAIKYAAKPFGWNVKIVPSNGTPASVKGAWGNVVRLKPDAAFGSGFDKTLYAGELKKLNALNVPVFSWATLDATLPDSNGKITLAKGGPDEVGIVGEQQAAWVVSDSKGDANTVYVDLPTFTILKPVREGFEKRYKEWCSGCAYDTMSVPLTAIGSKAPGMVVSYLRSHPEVNYVALSYDGVGVGLPAALKAAGLADKVKIVGEAPTATNISYVEAGTQGATVSQGYYEIWAMFVDAAARQITGQPLDASKSWKPPWFLVTKDNVAQGDGYKPLIPGLDAKLGELWNQS